MNSTLVIVLNYNGAAVLEECLRSLYHATGRFDVLVVDNNSSDGSESIAKKYGFQLLRSGVNLGYAGGNNLGIRQALEQNYEYVLLLNNDAVVAPGFLSPLLEAMSDPQAGFAGPKVYRYFPKVDSFYDCPVLSWAGGYIDLWRGRGVSIGDGEYDLCQHDQQAATGFINGCCIMIKTSVLKEIGLLDESFFMYWEEADLCMRGRQAGYQSIYVPVSWVWHHVEGKGNQYLYARNRFWYMKRYASFAQFSCFLLYNLLVDLPRLSLHFVFNREYDRVVRLLRGNLVGALT